MEYAMLIERKTDLRIQKTKLAIKETFKTTTPLSRYAWMGLPMHPDLLLCVLAFLDVHTAFQGVSGERTHPGS